MCMSITQISILNADIAMSSRFVQSTAYRKIRYNIDNSNSFTFLHNLTYLSYSILWLKTSSNTQSIKKLGVPPFLSPIHIIVQLQNQAPLILPTKIFPSSVHISVQSLSHVQLFVTPWTAACQASLSITNSGNLLKLMSIESVMPSNHLILRHPLLFLLSIFPSIRVFSNKSVLHIRCPIIGVSASESVLSMNIQDWFPLDWLVCSLCSPRDSQESSPTPQFKSISSSALSFLYGPTLTSIHDYWNVIILLLFPF